MRKNQLLLEDPKLLNQLSDDAFQSVLLEGVSRTFALTIPQLPEALRGVVANAYLLCRIVDTIEDEVSLSPEQKTYFFSEFISIVQTGVNSEPFAVDLAPLLSSKTLPAEHTLIHVLPRVIEITHSFDAAQIEALACCVETMAEGMLVFQTQNLHDGLAALADMDKYCYYVAGCVGEMLTKLFCHYSPEIAVHKAQLLALSVSFGQGLQMTNILKDIWDDAERGVCWLPQDIFTEAGFNLKNLTPENKDEHFKIGLARVISVAHTHLHNALVYAQLIPTHEIGIRKFCLWAIGMALLTLKKIKQNLSFNKSNQIKISRNSVKTTLLTTKLIGRSNIMLSVLFNSISRDLNVNDWQYAIAPKVKHVL